MSLSAFLLFAAVYVVAVATPGPGITALIARVVAVGPRHAGAMIAGFVVGDLVWFAAAATGLSVLATHFAAVFIAIKWLGIVYLLWLAWQLWSAPLEFGELRRTENAEKASHVFLAALALTLGNPKVMIFFLAILPTVIDLGGIGAGAAIVLGLAIVIILTGILAAYVLLADRIRVMIRTPRAMRIVNRACSATITAAAAAIAAR